MNDLLCEILGGREVYVDPVRLPPGDAPYRATAQPPTALGSHGYAEPCRGCGAKRDIYSVVIDDVLGHDIDIARRDPLCVDCTVTKARALHDEGGPVSAGVLAWACARDGSS